MKSNFLNYATLAVLSGWLTACSTTPTPSAADYHLAAPQIQAERAYLGLPKEIQTFQLNEIHCEILVIDCFDMYCHICQTGAKHVNELYRLAQERGLGDRVKFVGLGIGDTPLEVATYKDKFKVPFPLFPDRRSLIVKQFGELRLPNLIVLRNRAGRLEVLHRSPGPLLNPAEILSHIQIDLGQLNPHHWSDAMQASQPTCAEKSGTCRASTTSEDHGTNTVPAVIR